ncbi:MAG: hypothetical protein ABR499_10060, partial [Gemmatimonadaceae bacterium]
IIKFTTLFGLLAVELAVSLANERGPGLTSVLAAVFLAISLTFVYRSFYGMRIEAAEERAGARPVAARSDLRAG